MPDVNDPEACYDPCHGCGNHYPHAITYVGDNTGWTPTEGGGGCGCGGNEFHEHHKDECGCSEKRGEKSSRFIFLGACGPESHETFSNVKQAVKEMGFADEVVPIGDAAEVAKYGVNKIPALVVDNQVVSVGRVLTVEDVKIIFQKKEIKKQNVRHCGIYLVPSELLR